MSNNDQATCAWIQDDDGEWHSACNLYWRFDERSPKGNGWNCCPACGKPITECEYDPKEDCQHDDGHEGGVCNSCGADVTQELVMAAEAAADAREDR